MKTKRIRKVLIANRGEIAMRVIRTCKEMGIVTVAVYSDADRLAPHVLHADEAYHVGPSPSAQSYLQGNRIIETARKAGADAIHPGYGFLSENGAFAQQVADAGLVFVGPSPEAIRAMGDKTEARKLVMSAGVPTVPGTPGSIASLDEARGFCERTAFPVLIKAAAGGGGKGMRIVRSMEELGPLFESAQSEASSAFGDGRVYLEKYLEQPRHVEFQILADHHGNVIHLGERECSIQRRHQKVVEESPSPMLDDTLREAMAETAIMAAKACGYRNAGTIEFLVDMNRNFYFLEMNTRLQVEHPVTELRTGIDLVAQQIHVAMGKELAFTQKQVNFRGHAIECRICAEDPHNGFLPSTGRITHLKPAQGFGVRDDRGVEKGGEVSVYYDPLLAKLIVWGATRDEAIGRMTRALREYQILGVKTNIAFCLFVMNHPQFQAGDFDTHFIPNNFTSSSLEQPAPETRKAIALVCATIASESGTQTQTPSSNGSAAFNGSDVTMRRITWKSQRFRNMRGAE